LRRATIRFVRLSAQSNVRIEARARELVGEGRYAEALMLLEIRFSQPDAPVALLPPYVLCLYATGKALRAEQAARRAKRELARLPRSETTEVSLAMLANATKVGERLAQGRATDSLWS